MVASITVICQTVNRPQLQGMIWSWVAQALVPGDRLLLYGDGCRPEAPRWPGIEVFECPKAGNGPGFPGLVHLDKAMDDGLPGDYVTHIDDDDLLWPGAFARVRPLLDGRVIVLPYSYPSDPPGALNFYTKPGIWINDKDSGWQTETYISWSLFPNRRRDYGFMSTSKSGGDGAFYAKVIRDSPRVSVLDAPFGVLNVGREDKVEGRLYHRRSGV